MSCVIAPKAQILPQYNRPHNTVVTIVEDCNRYHARLCLNGGRFHRVSAKTFHNR